MLGIRINSKAQCLDTEEKFIFEYVPKISGAKLHSSKNREYAQIPLMTGEASVVVVQEMLRTLFQECFIVRTWKPWAAAMIMSAAWMLVIAYMRMTSSTSAASTERTWKKAVSFAARTVMWGINCDESNCHRAIYRV